MGWGLRAQALLAEDERFGGGWGGSVSFTRPRPISQKVGSRGLWVQLTHLPMGH